MAEAVANYAPFMSALSTKYKIAKETGDTQAVSQIFTLVFIILALYIFFIIYAFYCLIQCAKVVPTWQTVLLAIGLFIPKLGGLVAIGVILYYHTYCKDHIRPTSYYVPT